MVYKFTKCGERVLSISNELAIDLGHSYIGTEHTLRKKSWKKPVWKNA